MFLDRNKAITELLTLAQAGAVREGEYCVTLSGFWRTYICLKVELAKHEVPPRAAEQAKEASPAASDSAPPAIRSYTTTSYFLRQCHRYLFADNPSQERQLIVSGPSFSRDDRHMLDLLVAVELANASCTGVEADIPDLFRCLTELDRDHGLLLLGLFHSHLWKGRSAVTPSDTDRRLQKTLEESGYKTVQGIFSEDGLCGLFTNTIPFALEILDRGFEEVERHETQTVIKLTPVSTVSDQAFHTPKPAGASLQRPADAYLRV